MGRLAFREEGDFWNCYYCKTDTLQDALLLGTIRINFVVNGSPHREKFMAVMRDILSDAVLAATGKRPDYFKEQDAPEHERTKE